MVFTKSVQPGADKASGIICLIFNSAGKLLVKNQGARLDIPNFTPEQEKGIGLENKIFLGYADNLPCFTAGLIDGKEPKGFKWVNLRSLIRYLDQDTWNLVGYARQIRDSHVNFRFCGKCGRKTHSKSDEQARFCTMCNLTFYPRISPAIITAVIRDDRILLARGINFPNKKMFSVLAGFVDAQERLEDCVKREVFEETGIRVKNVTYFNSQPWPFPDSLMIGFTADYDSGEIRIDPAEIAEAGWFRADELPLVPGKPTLSGELISWFAAAYGPGLG